MAFLFASRSLRKNKLGAIELDLTIDEMHQRNAEVSDFPVESGGQIQDHISNGPRKLTITGFITDTPLGALFSYSFANRVQDAFDSLEELYDSRTPFDVVSGLKSYKNMCFESLDMPRKREGALQFTATLKQLTIVSSENVAIPETKVKPSAKSTSASKRDAGRKSTEAASAAESQRGGSVLFKLGKMGVDAVSGAFQ